MKVRVWSINRWLRYTGFRLFVVQDGDEFTHLEVAWVGLPGSAGWKKWEPDN